MTGYHFDPPEPFEDHFDEPLDEPLEEAADDIFEDGAFDPGPFDDALDDQPPAHGPGPGLVELGADAPAEVVAARAEAAAARSAAATSADRLGAARDRLADLEGSVRVAEAKVEDYRADTGKSDWQRTAAAESLAKAARARLRAVQLVDQRALEHVAAEAAATAADQAVQDAIDKTAADTDPPPLYYGSTNEFVREHLRYVYQRKINGSTLFWSPRWWTSAEATARLEALWRSWEHLRLDPSTGASVWWRDHADHHMSVLMSSAGPFSKEINVKATILEPLPHEEPPEGLFPDVRTPLQPN